MALTDALIKRTSWLPPGNVPAGVTVHVVRLHIAVAVFPELYTGSFATNHDLASSNDESL